MLPIVGTTSLRNTTACWCTRQRAALSSRQPAFGRYTQVGFTKLGQRMLLGLLPLAGANQAVSLIGPRPYGPGALVPTSGSYYSSATEAPAPQYQDISIGSLVYALLLWSRHCGWWLCFSTTNITLACEVLPSWCHNASRTEHQIKTIRSCFGIRNLDSSS
ncbi:hypothetical protein CONLIGDRAFT_437758 [Coniochaeta ligniaria NRRL 30616]|uniref:Uncharacterized protein n=1 Tax=Coniochaeta ligniaria NRRL 30616 TaxID=1408157 RepID=A0A1J7JCV3_9PEZI|nr:hypothetical protein CONLIGDRAFT_437758 [Coniochaeta ligniaria NRRL 30616]